MYRASRACLDAFTAADAFCTVAVLNRINVHFAYVGAFAASDAFILVKRHMNKTYFIKLSEGKGSQPEEATRE